MPLERSVSMAGATTPVVGSVLRDSLGNYLNLSVDAFARLRVSQPLTVLNVKQTDIAPSSILMASEAISGGTVNYNSATASTALTTTSAAGSKITYMTRRRIGYQPGKSQLALVTFRMVAPAAVDGRVRSGAFCGGNAIFLSRAQASAFATGMSVVLKSASGLGTIEVPQESWSLDKLDGSKNPLTNPSGITLNPDKVQVFAVAFEWLGVGDIVVGFYIRNIFIPVHVFENGNIQIIPYTSTPNMALFWQAEGGGGVSQIYSTCGVVISEGGSENVGYNGGDYLNVDAATTSGTMVEILSIRLRCAGAADGDEAITSATVFPIAYSAFNVSNDAGLLAVCYNPTFTGAGTWGDPIGNAGAQSHVQVCKSHRPVTDVGHIISQEMFSNQTKSASGSFDSVTGLGCAAKSASTPGYGVADVISLVHINVSGSNTNTRGTLSWREVP